MLAPIKEWATNLPNLLPTFDLAPRSRLLYETVQARDALLEQVKEVADVQVFDPWALPSTAIARLPISGLQVSLDDRWSIFGTSGSGKTVAAKAIYRLLCRLYPGAARYVVNSKPDDHFDAWGPKHIGDTLPPLVGPGEMMVWEPYDNDRELYDAWFGQILKEQSDIPCILLIDELSSIGGDSGISYPQNYKRLLKQGRSLHKCLITLTQDAAYIPRQVLGQATHVVRMRLLEENDAARLDRMLHGSDNPRREPASRFGLYHRRLDTPAPAKFYSDWHALLA